MERGIDPKGAQRAFAHWLRGPSLWLSSVVPLLVTLGRLAPAGQWRDDMALVRGFGFVPFGGEGILSALLTQVASLVPLGGLVLRAALPSALGAAAAAALVYSITLRLLDRNALSPRLGPLLSLLTAWAVVLGPAWQTQSTLAGGASLGAALVLGSALVRLRLRLEDRGWFGFGALLGAALLESRVAGLACLVFLAADAALLHQLPRPRQLMLLLGANALVLALGLLPFLAEPSRGGLWMDMGRELSRLSGGANPTDLENTLSAWLSALGPLATTAALVGGLWGLGRARTRPWIAPFAALLLLDLALPTTPESARLLAADAGAPVRLVALAALGIAAALGVHTLCLGLERARVPLARPAAVMLLALSFTLALVAVDESGRVTEREQARASEAWTDEALGTLPPHSLLLVRSEPAAFRVWAARVARGERPDVLVVPLPLLDRGDTAARLLALEPRLGPLIRELRVSGKPSEYALSSLADARPLFLEFDPAWDGRLLEHMLPHAFWMQFAPHALGRSDRTAALRAGRESFSRVLRTASDPLPDRATLFMLGHRAREQAVLLAALGDRDNARDVVSELGERQEASGFLGDVQQQLTAKSRRVDWLALLK